MELTTNFATLRAFGGLSSEAALAISILESMPVTDRRAMAQALLRRSHTEAIAAQGDALSLPEQQQVNSWLQRCRDVAFADSDDPRRYDADRRRLKTAVSQAVAVLSDKHRPAQPYVRTRGPWRVDTHVEFGGRLHQVSYFHVITWEGQLVKSGLGPLEWLGISSTALNRVRSGEETTAAAIVANLMRVFFSAESELMPL